MTSQRFARRPLSATSGATPWWLAMDVVVVLIFAAIGRNSHDEGVNLAGIAATSGPFLGGTAIGWLASRAWVAPTLVRPTGLIVWACALVAGMVLRVLTGGGIEVSFVIVAGVFLALFLLGWRLVVGRLTDRS